MLSLAMNLYRAPIRFQHLLHSQAELPAGVDVVLRAAADDGFRKQDAATLSGAGSEELRAAATFFVEQVFFTRGANYYRTLGLNADASQKQIKEHHRLLMRLFHPDHQHTQDTWTDVYAQRVNQAYNTLRKPHTRRSYDASLLRPRLQDKGVPGLPRRAWVPRKVPFVMPRSGSERIRAPSFVSRYLPQFVLVAVGLLAILTTGAYVAGTKSWWLAPTGRAPDPRVVPAREAEGRFTAAPPDDQESPLYTLSEQAAIDEVLGAVSKTVVSAAEAADTERRKSERSATGAADEEAMSRVPGAKADVNQISQPVSAADGGELTGEGTAQTVGRQRADSSDSPSVHRHSHLAASRADQQPKVGISGVHADRAVQDGSLGERADASVLSASVRRIGVPAPPKAIRSSLGQHAPTADGPDSTAMVGSRVAAQSSNGAKPVGRTVTDRELETLIGKFIGHYDRGDLRAFMALFADHARSSNRDGKAGIQEDYAILFGTTKARDIKLIDVKWRRSLTGATGHAGFVVQLQRLANSDPTVSAGTLTIEVARQADDVLIVGLFHDVTERSSATSPNR